MKRRRTRSQGNHLEYHDGALRRAGPHPTSGQPGFRPAIPFGGSQSETKDAERVPERDPVPPVNGSWSETTSKTKSSYQAEPEG